MGSIFTRIQLPRRSYRPGDMLMTWLLSYGHYHDNKASFVRGICHLPELPHCSIQHTCQQVVHVICRFLGAQYFLKTPANMPAGTAQACPTKHPRDASHQSRARPCGVFCATSQYKRCVSTSTPVHTGSVLHALSRRLPPTSHPTIPSPSEFTMNDIEAFFAEQEQHMNLPDEDVDEYIRARLEDYHRNRNHVSDHVIPAQGHPRKVNTRPGPFLTSDMEGEEQQVSDKEVPRKCVSDAYLPP
ncbi:hypothetical protein BDR05DRAFT_172152 [Suillus weaverae]|nr:hypothetical protein BDR05DRAFT_172152 [Suillus weaverae]